MTRVAGNGRVSTSAQVIPGSIEEAIDLILKIARERDKLLRKLKEALANNDDQNIKKYSSKLCGIKGKK